MFNTSAGPAFCGTGIFLRMSAVSMATGAMMNTVSTMASPFMTMAGGTCCTPRALRTSDVTTTIFTYDVTIMMKNGASPRSESPIRR